MDFVRRFEENIERELGNCGVAFPIKKNIALGVSGGADSIALLTAVMHIVEKQYIKVISVNHNIRPASETVGDAKYVFDYCAKNGVLCEIHEISRGCVEAYFFALLAWAKRSSTFIQLSSSYAMPKTKCISPALSIS